MKQVKKVKFYTDKDGTEWTFKPLRIMTKIDIIKILDLYFINHQTKNLIYLKRSIKYGKIRIKKLLDKLEKLWEINGKKLPNDYINKLYSVMNKKHIEKEECNRFIIKEL